MNEQRPTSHNMQRRMATHNYALPGIYHITIHVAEGMGQPLGQIQGSLELPDDSQGSPHVAMTPVGQMVREELLTSITGHYRMITVDTFVIMPEHLHVLLHVTAPIVSSNGRSTHLGQVIAGFKKGCNRRYWSMTGQNIPTGEPSDTSQLSGGSPACQVSGGSPACQLSGGSPACQHSGGSPANRVSGGSPANRVSGGSPANRVSGGSPANRVSGGFPAREEKRAPSDGTTGRRPLFAYGYCDVQPITPEQLATQRAYIKGNPRSRLLRSSQRTTLTASRTGYITALTPSALCGFLQRQCLPKHATPEALAAIECRLLLAEGKVALDTYGDCRLLDRCLLPVICHRMDSARLIEQKARCLAEAAHGAILVSPRIAPGEQDIMNEAVSHGFPVIIVTDNGFPERYHPSTERIDQCAKGQLLLVTPWQYQYRGKNEQVTIPFCKAMNCVAQALCRTKDDWWKKSMPSGPPAHLVPSGPSAPLVPSGSPAHRVLSGPSAHRVSSGSPAGPSSLIQ